MHASRERWCTDARTRERNQRGSQRIAQPCMPERDPPCHHQHTTAQTRLPSPLTPPKLPPDHCQALKSRCHAPHFSTTLPGHMQTGIKPRDRGPPNPLKKQSIGQAAAACDARQPEKAVHRRARASTRRGSARVPQPCIAHAGSPAPTRALVLASYPQLQITTRRPNLPKVRYAHDLCAACCGCHRGACLASWEGRLQRHAHGGAGARLPSPACSMAM